jgi:hypothetical protein
MHSTITGSYEGEGGAAKSSKDETWPPRDHVAVNCGRCPEGTAEVASSRQVKLGIGRLQPTHHVFGDINGAARHPGWITDRWRDAIRAKRLGVTLHALRHSHASALIASAHTTWSQFRVEWDTRARPSPSASMLTCLTKLMRRRPHRLTRSLGQLRENRRAENIARSVWVPNGCQLLVGTKRMRQGDVTFEDRSPKS